MSTRTRFENKAWGNWETVYYKPLANGWHTWRLCSPIGRRKLLVCMRKVQRLRFPRLAYKTCQLPAIRLASICQHVSPFPRVLLRITLITWLTKMVDNNDVWSLGTNSTYRIALSVAGFRKCYWQRSVTPALHLHVFTLCGVKYMCDSPLQK